MNKSFFSRFKILELHVNLKSFMIEKKLLYNFLGKSIYRIRQAVNVLSVRRNKSSAV